MDARLHGLSIDEKLQLIEDLWDSIAADQAALPMTAAQRAEIDHRLENSRLTATWGTKRRACSKVSGSGCSGARRAARARTTPPPPPTRPRPRPHAATGDAPASLRCSAPN
jgi:putative addiction module component (TIGR02574 family)